MGRKKKQKQPERLIKYKPKRWQTTLHSIYNQEEIEHRLNNNLPIDDIIDTLNNKYNKNK